MAITYDAIASTTISGSSTTTVTFSSISANYTDLIIVYGGQGTTNANILLKLNSDTGSNYSRTYMYGDGGSVITGRESALSSLGIFYTSNSQTTSILQIMNYANTTTYKTILSRNNLSTLSTTAYVAMWKSTAAISQIDLTIDAGNYAANSVISLYGIKAA